MIKTLTYSLIYIFAFISIIVLFILLLIIAPINSNQKDYINGIIYILERNYGLSAKNDITELLEIGALSNYIQQQYFLGNLYIYGHTTTCKYRLEGCENVAFDNNIIQLTPTGNYEMISANYPIQKCVF